MVKESVILFSSIIVNDFFIHCKILFSAQSVDKWTVHVGHTVCLLSALSFNFRNFRSMFITFRLLLT